MIKEKTEKKISSRLEGLVRKALKDFKNKRNIFGPFDNPKDMDKLLDADL